jgi:hypothetical protein
MVIEIKDEPGVRRETCGSPSRGAGSNCRLESANRRQHESTRFAGGVHRFP